MKGTSNVRRGRSTFEGDVQPPLLGAAAFEGRKCQKHRKLRVVAVVLWRRGWGEGGAGRGRCFWNSTICYVTNAELSILAVFFFFSRSIGTEEITIDPNSQWNPVPVKLVIKEEGGLLWATLNLLQLT